MCKSLVFGYEFLDQGLMHDECMKEKTQISEEIAEGNKAQLSCYPEQNKR